MKVTILACCQVCEKQFVFECPPGSQPLPEQSRDLVEFADGQTLVRHKYVRSFAINNHGHFEHNKTDHAMIMCESCDAQYWANFNDAVKKLESFWHGPLVDAEFKS